MACLPRLLAYQDFFLSFGIQFRSCDRDWLFRPDSDEANPRGRVCESGGVSILEPPRPKRTQYDETTLISAERNPFLRASVRSDG